VPSKGLRPLTQLPIDWPNQRFVIPGRPHHLARR